MGEQGTLRSKAAADAIKFTVDKVAAAQPSTATNNEDNGKVENGVDIENTEVSIDRAEILKKEQQTEEEFNDQIACSLDDPDDCEMCGS